MNYAMCNVRLKDGEPYWEANDRCLCRNCSLNSCEFFVDLNLGGFMLFWLEGLKNKYFGKMEKIRSCYLPKKLKKEILLKYKFTCQDCGTKDNLTIDHIKPVSKGGLNEASNLTVLCKSCNSRKGVKYND